jgi:hypothetical protein
VNDLSQQGLMPSLLEMVITGESFRDSFALHNYKRGGPSAHESCAIWRVNQVIKFGIRCVHNLKYFHLDLTNGQANASQYLFVLLLSTRFL